MKGYKRKIETFLCLSLILLLLNCLPATYAAESEFYTTDSSNVYITEFEVYEEEEEEFLANFEQDITIDGVNYTVYSIEKEEDEENTKTVSVTETQNSLNTNNEDTIKETFGETYKYSEDGYTGTLEISDIDIEEVYNGTYEQIETMDIPFTNYTINDLNNISKTLTSTDGTVYYLIDVDWSVQNSETVAGEEVSSTYSGTMHYETLVEYDNPYLYNVTVTYSGEVEKENKLYIYTATYEIVEEEVVEEEVIEEVVEEESSPIVPIIISILGLILIIILLVIFSKNTKIYNKTSDGRYVLVKRARISTNKLSVNLTGIDYKATTNLFAIELKKRTFNKIGSNSIAITKGNKTINIYIKDEFTDFTI